MKVLRYFILALFICSVFSCVSVSTKYLQFVGDNDLFLKENSWLMLKSEKKAFEEAKTDKEKEQIIEQFWKARDPNLFTEKNELRSFYEQNLIEVRKDYSVSSDSRRYVYLLFGKPDFKLSFSNETVSVASPFVIRVRVDRGEIWKYTSRGRDFQAIFANLSPYELQQVRDSYAGEEAHLPLFGGSKLEILYFGPSRYLGISDFIGNFFQGGFRLETTEETIDDLKKPVLKRAENFYKGVVPEIKKRNYSQTFEKKDIRVLIHPFEISSPEEAGIAFWILLDQDTLNSKKKKYYANLSLFCEVRDSNGERIIHYQEDSIEYKLETKKNYFYHFWGSLTSGKYKIILEIAENIGKRYKKFEVDIQTFDYSIPGLKAEFLVGKMFEYSDNSFQGKPGYFSLKEGNFCPVFGNLYNDEFIFREDDEMVILFDVAGFQKDNYGNPSVEVFPLFTRGELGQNNEFVPTQEAQSCSGYLLGKVDSPFRGILRLKIADLVKDIRLNLSSGLYKVGLLIQDRIAGRKGEGTKEFPHPIQIQIEEKQ